MEAINTYLSGIIMPAMLMIAGIYLGARLRFFYIFRPRAVGRELFSGAKSGGVSPLRALTQALAGTLGVGNMTGVATAVCQGGPGAVFWMWISALVAMSLKYFEVVLAVKYRKRGPCGYFGGAMYYIGEIFSKPFPGMARVFGGAFAFLCIMNSLLTGNMVQMNSAAAVFPNVISPLLLGVLCALLALFPILGKGKGVSGVTAWLIPLLSALYMIISLVIIIPRLSRLPSVIGEIIRGAFSLRAAGGGAMGFAIARAIRFGTTRGLFSNEAGSGTSPTAHAMADAKSPHSQGCLGIFEVFADTIVLCTMTAFVILLSDGCAKGFGGISLTLYAFSSQAGAFAGIIMGISVIFFAYATVICQAQYGIVALGYFTKKRWPKAIFIIIFLAVCVWGTVVGEGVMWQAADLCISLMTVLNVISLIAAQRKNFKKEKYTP